MTNTLINGIKNAWIKKLAMIMALSVFLLMTGIRTANARGGDSQETPESQQNKVHITGSVADPAGEPVTGANVIEKGVSTNGTITDADGKFSLNVSPGATLVVSYIGYVTQEIAVGNRTQLQITLQEDLQALEEVVVIGYGTVKKSDLTGSVASVSDKQFKDQPVKRIEDILQGRTPGVEVTTQSGMPGGGIKVRIRGTTSINKSSDPLYIVDGIVSTSGLEGLNPSDIQSIEVLKDASATAIYGSRGANGVVLVTTRRGQEGKSQITVDATVGVSNLIKKYDLLSAYEYALALNDIWGSSTVSAADVEAYKNGTKGVDWQDLMTKTGISQDYKLSISGGNAKNRYLVSGNLLDISAITITTRFQRAQLRVNLDTEVTPWLTMSTKLNASRMHAHNNGVGLMEAINYSPAMELKNEDTGVYNRDPYNAVNNSPYGGRMVNYNDNYRYYLNGNLNLLFRIVDGLTLSVQGGANYYHNPSYSFTSSLAGPGVINGMSNGSGMNVYWQNTDNLTYQKTFGDHSITATAVWEASNITYTGLSISGSNLSNEIVGYWNISNAATRSEGNDYSAESIASGIGRLMYSYKGRYLLTGTFRADGSSKFQGDNKWGYFPSGALAWDVAKEEFMSDLNLFQQLKARASFGITGNQDIGRYSTLGMLSTTSYGWGTSTPYTGYWGNSFATPNVRWEKTYQYDIGVDLSVLNSRLNFTFDWFLKDSKDLLFQKTVPSYNGGGSFWVNQGEVKNSGVEFSVNTIPVNRNDLAWETTLNASYVKNEVVDLAGTDFILENVDSATGGASQIMKPGYPLGSFYLYQWKGFDNAGANLYQREDGSLTTSPTGDDQVIMGQANPKWTLGWNNTVSWKNWSASFFVNGAFGHNRLNMTRYMTASMTGLYRFITLRDAYYKGWDKVENKADALFQSHTSSESKNYGNSDNWLENASFLKLKNISIAYRIPKRIVKVADIQLSVSAQNVFVLTKYKGMDPEVYSLGSGGDWGAYPVPRTFTFGAKLDF
jgi:TonB-linked SusC/RagA family outer membrane protein